MCRSSELPASSVSTDPSFSRDLALTMPAGRLAFAADNDGPELVLVRARQTLLFGSKSNPNPTTFPVQIQSRSAGVGARMPMLHLQVGGE